MAVNYLPYMIGIEWDNTLVSVLNLEKTRNCRLKFSIPYAKQTLTWEMYFNPLYPELGPDLAFDEEEYLYYGNIHHFASNLPSLVKWNPINRKSLLQLLREILELYKQYQIELLKLCIDKLTYQNIKLVRIFQLKDLEIIVIRESKQIKSKFLIKLNCELPTTLFKQLTNVVILLYISIFGPTLNSIIPELYLPLSLVHLFGGSKSLHIPPFDELKYFNNYTKKLKESIIKKVLIISKYIQKRKNFIAVLLVMYSSKIIEYDIAVYKRVSLLFEYSDFHFILSFSLPINFPNKQFSIKLQSIYHMSDQGEPVYMKIDNFPYNSNWEPKYMIKKALSYIFEKEIMKFRYVSETSIL